MPAVNSRRRSIVRQVLEVLWTARRETGAEEIRRAVINSVAPGICALELQPVVKSAVQLRSQAVIDGTTIGRKLHDGLLIEERLIGGKDIVDAFQLRQIEGKGVKRCLRWRSKERR